MVKQGDLLLDEDSLELFTFNSWRNNSPDVLEVTRLSDGASRAYNKRGYKFRVIDPSKTAEVQDAIDKLKLARVALNEVLAGCEQL